MREEEAVRQATKETAKYKVELFITYHEIFPHLQYSKREEEAVRQATKETAEYK